MWHLKLKVMAATGAASVFFGAMFRFCARYWSRDINGVTDPEMRLNIIEAGTWVIVFGIIVMALALNRWVAGDPEKSKSATQT